VANCLLSGLKVEQNESRKKVDNMPNLKLKRHGETDDGINQRVHRFSCAIRGRYAPINPPKEITTCAAYLGYKGMQIPTSNTRLFDLAQAANNLDHCDEKRRF